MCQLRHAQHHCHYICIQTALIIVKESVLGARKVPALADHTHWPLVNLPARVPHCFAGRCVTCYSTNHPASYIGAFRSYHTPAQAYILASDLAAACLPEHFDGSLSTSNPLCKQANSQSILSVHWSSASHPPGCLCRKLVSRSVSQ